MGLVTSLLRPALEVNGLLLGLDETGKTTILNFVKSPGTEVETREPTRDFVVQSSTLRTKSKIFSLQAWSLGGRGKFRPLWRHWYRKTNALIFVVDLSDRERLDRVREALWQILEEEELLGVPLLVLGNKEDLPGCMEVQQVMEELGLHKLRDRLWYIEKTCALTGAGLFEGLEWLERNVRVNC